MSEAVLAVPLARHQPVTPWRAELVETAEKMVRLIQDNDDPECQFRTTADITSDIVQAVKMRLRQKYGRTFDSLVDGPEQKPA
jgi:hypothetical protein